MIVPLYSGFTVASGATAVAPFDASQLSDVADSLRIYATSDADAAAPPLSLVLEFYALNTRAASVAEARAGVKLVEVSMPAVPVVSGANFLHHMEVIIPLAFRVDPAARYFALVVTAPTGPDWSGAAIIDVFRRELRAEL